MIKTIVISLARVAGITVLLLLLIEGFLTEALAVSIKEGQADLAVEAARKLAEQSTILIQTILAVFL